MHKNTEEVSPETRLFPFLLRLVQAENKSNNPMGFWLSLLRIFGWARLPKMRFYIRKRTLHAAEGCCQIKILIKFKYHQKLSGTWQPMIPPFDTFISIRRYNTVKITPEEFAPVCEKCPYALSAVVIPEVRGVVSQIKQVWFLIFESSGF